MNKFCGGNYPKKQTSHSSDPFDTETVHLANRYEATAIAENHGAQPKSRFSLQ